MFKRTIILIGIVGIVALNLNTSVMGTKRGSGSERSNETGKGVTYVREFTDANGAYVYEYLDAKGNSVYYERLPSSGKTVKGYMDGGKFVSGSPPTPIATAPEEPKARGTWQGHVRTANGKLVEEFLYANGKKVYYDATGNKGYLDRSGKFIRQRTTTPAERKQWALMKMDLQKEGAASAPKHESKESKQIKLQGKWQRNFRAANGIIVTEYLNRKGITEYWSTSGERGSIDGSGKFISQSALLKATKKNQGMRERRMNNFSSTPANADDPTLKKLRMQQQLLGLTEKNNYGWQRWMNNFQPTPAAGSSQSGGGLAGFIKSKGLGFPGGWMALPEGERFALQQEFLGIGGAQGGESEDSFRHDVFGPQGDETEEQWLERLAKNIWQSTYDKVLLKRAQDRINRERMGFRQSLINQAQANMKWIAEKDEAEAKYAADSAAGLAGSGQYYYQLLKNASEQELMKQNLHRDGTARVAYGNPKNRGVVMGPKLDYANVDAEEARQRRQAAASRQRLRERFEASIAESEANREQRAAEIEARNQEIKETRIARIRSEGGRDTGGGGGASVAWTDSEGNERRIETDGAGGRRETTVTGGGTTNVVETRADGVKIQTTTTVDNETTKVITRTDEHGNTVETKEISNPGHPTDGTKVVTTTTTDPKTGEQISDVVYTVPKGASHDYMDGTKPVWEKTGGTYVRSERVVKDRDGTVIRTETNVDGVTWSKDKDGNVTEVSGNGYTGGTTERIYDKNGTLTVVEKDNNGKVTSQENFMFERTENKNGDTELVVHNDDGFSTTYSQNQDGSLKFKDSTRQEREDRGRDLYLEQKADLELSSNWDDLSESAKQEYNRERDRRNEVAERREREEQQRRDLEASRLAAKNKREEEERQYRLEMEQNQRELDKKLAKIEQERQEHMRRYEDLMDGPEHEGQQNIADSTPENIDKKVEDSVTQQTSGVANTRDRPSGNAVDADETPTPKPKGPNLLEMRSGDKGISVSEFQEKWIGREMRGEEGQVIADSKDPGRLSGWKAAREILSNVEDEVYDVGATVIKAPLDVVTAIYGVPGGRVGSVIKDAFGELVDSKGDVYTAAVNTVIDQIIDVGIEQTKNKYFGEATDLGSVADAAMATDGAHPLEGGTKLQDLGKGFAEGVVEYVQGVSIKQERKTVVFTRNQIRTDVMNNYAVDTVKTTVYDENTGKGAIIIETASQRALEVENTGFVFTNLEAKGRFREVMRNTIVIPFTGKGEDAKLGEPHMLTRREQRKMQQQHSR